MTNLKTSQRRARSGVLMTISCAILLACSTPAPPPVVKSGKTNLGNVPQNAPVNYPVLAREAPPLPREFRAAWVSTVANIDWPSRRDLSSDKQKAEILNILDNAVSLKLNAIVLQVRPAADAIYPSSIEPWSEFLTGEQGRPPSPYYDPLQFWVEQAHARGLELHAWFNPYRARTAQSKTVMASNHISKQFPQVVKTYGDLQWMDPGEPIAIQQTLNVIGDVARRYDVDGIHIDDYFYPYPVKNGNSTEIDFPDDPSWIAYLQAGGSLNRADWRRSNVNHLVEAIHLRVHQEKPWIKFGISPFGIGRPDRLPPGIAGFSQYDKLYADVELWLAQGWLDYLAPQLYWPINQGPQAFKVLLDYWLAQNSQNKHVWPGLYTSRIDSSDKSWPTDEILNQVDAMREKGGNGHLHFSMAALNQNRKDIRKRLSTEKYTSQALIPASPWLDASLPGSPVLEASADKKSLRLQLPEPVPGIGTSNARLLAIWKRTGQQWLFSVLPAQNMTIDLADDPQFGAIKQVTVSTISRTGQESLRSSYSLP
ncbi:family 10 glycosylhydrolase [Undibacterium sp. TS12]|uniref:glycoside hydrolase family 10 protein n=1 Tax=Undibacterium sp. TS12 TaxID=2908202 RepID=UPI001F4CB778|nr:family 10 glycosylhydrolase [Undibacterium sp. TS12]MCH8619300.1 family 10 glycosylhydrolase [Undibacterium sp. TS12]